MRSFGMTFSDGTEVNKETAISNKALDYLFTLADRHCEAAENVEVTAVFDGISGDVVQKKNAGNGVNSLGRCVYGCFGPKHKMSVVLSAQKTLRTPTVKSSISEPKLFVIRCCADTLKYPFTLILYILPPFMQIVKGARELFY